MHIWGVAVFLLWTVFSLPARAEDLRLDDLIAEALKNNPDIQAAEARAAAAGQRISQEASLMDPMFSIGYQNEGFEEYTYGEAEDAQWMFSLSQTFPFPGKRSLQREAAFHEAEALRAGAEAARREVASRVAQAYFDLFLAVKELDLIAARTPLAARLEEAALARYASGTGAQEEVIMAQSAKYMLLEAEAMARGRKETAEAMIRREANITDSAPLARPAALSPAPFPYTFEELVDRADRNAPMLTERNSMVAASQNRLLRAQKEAWPDLTLMGQYSNRGGGFEDMWGLTASVPLPLFYWRKQGAAVSENRWSLTGARRELEAARLKIASEIRDNLAMVRASDRIIELYRNALIPKSRQGIDAAIAAFSSGRMNASEALSALKAPFDYELVLWQQQVQREKAIARIKALTGDLEGHP
jgi:outer membrane protein TolC